MYAKLWKLLTKLPHKRTLWSLSTVVRTYPEIAFPVRKNSCVWYTLYVKIYLNSKLRHIEMQPSKRPCLLKGTIICPLPLELQLRNSQEPLGAV